MNDGKLILLVDDDREIRLAVTDILESEGYKVECAAGGEEALARIDRGTQPALILLDMMMPEMDGWTFVQELRKRGETRQVPVVVFTAAQGPGEIAAEIGAAGCLPKPLRLADLLNEVERLA